MFVLLTIFQSSMTKNSNRVAWEENSSGDEDSSDEHPNYDPSQLRHFLLTANAGQRAARLQEQEFNKRELVNSFENFKRTSFSFSLDSRISSIIVRSKS